MGWVFADHREGLEALGAQGGRIYARGWGQSSREQWAPCPRLAWFPLPTPGSKRPLDTGAASKKTRWGCFSNIQEITAAVMEKGVNRTLCTWETHPHGQMVAPLTSGHPELISYL